MSKINILYINHTTEVGGAALSLYNLINSVKDSVNPTILLPNKGGAYNFFVNAGITCIVFPFLPIVCKTNKFLNLKRIPLILRSKIINDKCIKYVYNSLKDKNIQIVHSNSSVITIGLYISKKLRAKHIWHIREFQDLDFNLVPFIGKNNLKRKIYSSDCIIAITKAVYNHFELYKVKNSLYLWDAVRSINDIIYKPEKSKFFFFCAARLCEAKGAEFAIKAFAKSNVWRQGYKLIMAGDVSVEYKEQLIKTAINTNIIDYIEFIGFQNEVNKYLENAAGFLMCSRNEGLGRVTIEAMFYGCPVIARNTGGSIEIIRDNENGLLFTDLNTCAEKIRYIINNPCTDIIKSAQNFVSDFFTEENYGKTIKKLYLKVLNKA